MGYLFLIVSLLTGTAKGYCGKRISGDIGGYKDAMRINFIRMLICTVIGLMLVLFEQGGVRQLKLDSTALLITALSGITTSVFVVCWIISVKKSAYMMLDIFLMLGIVVTLVGCSITLGESVRAVQWIGLAVLFAAVCIMCSYNKSLKGKMNILSVALLIICGVSNGLTDFSQKLFVNYSESNISVFNFYTYVFSAVVLLIFYLIFSKKEKNAETEKLSGRIFCYVLVMAACLFVSSYFKTLAAVYLDSAKLYPLNQGSALILSTVMSSVFFKEKITFKCIIGICMAFAALIIINVL